MFVRNIRSSVTQWTKEQTASAKIMSPIIRERSFELCHNPFNTQNFSYYSYSGHSTLSYSFHFSFFPIRLTLSFLLLLLSSTFRPTGMTSWAKEVLLNRAFLFSIHPPAFSIHLQIPLLPASVFASTAAAAAPSPRGLTVRSAFVSSALCTPGFWKISRWLSCSKETCDTVDGTFLTELRGAYWDRRWEISHVYTLLPPNN